MLLEKNSISGDKEQASAKTSKAAVATKLKNKATPKPKLRTTTRKTTTTEKVINKKNALKRKKKRKQKRKQKRQRMRRIEKSAMSKVPKEKIRGFRLNFNKGKIKTKSKPQFKFLQNLQFPFNEAGSLRSDFRKVVQSKVINKLPDYCEQSVLEENEKRKKECAQRAKRIKERIVERLKEMYF